MYALLIAGWRVMLGAWGQRLEGWTAARIWTVSSLGKYLPGKGLGHRGHGAHGARSRRRAVGRDGVRRDPADAGDRDRRGGGRSHGSARARIGAGRGAGVALAVLVAAAAAGVGLLLWPPVLRRLLRLVAPDAEARMAPAAGPVAFGVVANLVAWVGYGAALWMLARGLLPDAGLELVPAIAVFTASYLAGFLALIAPGGLGVREGLFILMLQGPLGIGAATALALASRVLLTITEFGAAVPFLAFPREKPRVAH